MQAQLLHKNADHTSASGIALGQDLVPSESPATASGEGVTPADAQVSTCFPLLQHHLHMCSTLPAHSGRRGVRWQLGLGVMPPVATVRYSS